jgi:hypothetical protein
VVAVIAALIWRLALAGPRFTALRFLGIAGCCVATAVLVAWMAAGPLEHGWAKAAGTPADLLAGSVGTPAGTAAPVAALSAGLNDPLVGSLVRSAASATATLTDSRDRTLQVVIVANADGSGTLTVTRSGARLCVAPATIGNSGVTGQCGAVLATIQVVDQGNGSASGTLATQKAGA